MQVEQRSVLDADDELGKHLLLVQERTESEV